jgi:uncharacterized membrane protein
MLVFRALPHGVPAPERYQQPGGNNKIARLNRDAVIVSQSENSGRARGWHLNPFGFASFGTINHRIA